MRPFGELFLLVQRLPSKQPFRAAPRTLAISALMVGGFGVTVALAGPAAASGGVTLYVNSTGSNAGNDCTQLLAPCATVSYAVSQAATGDTIEVVGTVEDNVNNFPSDISLSRSRATKLRPTRQLSSMAAAAGTVVTVASGSNVTLDYLTIQNGSTAGSGGGIENDGTLTVNNTTVTDNFSTGANGAGIDNTGTLTVSNSTISNNIANQNGGGISSEAGAITVSDTTISGNSASADGGGIDLAAGYGQITDSTITANTAGSGGGIDNGSGSLTVVDATISSNSSYGIAGSATTAATIVAEDTPADCQNTLTSTGYDLSSDSSCGFTAAGDSENADPELGGLTDNGGPTLTLMPGPRPGRGGHSEPHHARRRLLLGLRRRHRPTRREPTVWQLVLQHRCGRELPRFRPEHLEHRPSDLRREPVFEFPVHRLCRARSDLHRNRCPPGRRHLEPGRGPVGHATCRRRRHVSDRHHGVQRRDTGAVGYPGLHPDGQHADRDGPIERPRSTRSSTGPRTRSPSRPQGLRRRWSRPLWRRASGCRPGSR